MFTRILVPLDGSALAESVIPYAKVLAARSGGRLILIRAAQYASLLGDVAVGQYRAVETAEAYLAHLVEQLTRECIHAQAGVPFGGSTVEWILEEIEVRHANLVVMATHDRAGVDRLVHGSIAESVVHRSSVPVMLVRGDLLQRLMDKQPVLIVPLDGSDFSEAALPVALDLADVVSGRFVLVGITPKPGQLLAGQGGAITTYSSTEVAALDGSVRTHLEGIAQGIPSNVPVDVIVREGDAATEIAAAVQEYQAAAVVMATHGRSGALRTILGSVAGDVLHRTKVPVLVIRPRAVQQSDHNINEQLTLKAN